MKVLEAGESKSGKKCPRKRAGKGLTTGLFKKGEAIVFIRNDLATYSPKK